MISHWLVPTMTWSRPATSPYLDLSWPIPGLCRHMVSSPEHNEFKFAIRNNAVSVYIAPCYNGTQCYCVILKYPCLLIFGRTVFELHMLSVRQTLNIGPDHGQHRFRAGPVAVRYIYQENIFQYQKDIGYRICDTGILFIKLYRFHL